MTLSPIDHLLHRLATGHAPSAADIEAAVMAVLAGRSTEARTAALLTALKMRGESAEALAAVVRAMLASAEAFPPLGDAREIADTCGTGGDGQGTFNISTAAALLLAAAGVKVAKHGNRAATGRCGSADVLERLGVRLDLPPQVAKDMLEATNFCFLFAPEWHRGMRHVGPVRKQLPFRTLFNLCGPLANPARPTHQLVGVSDKAAVEPMAQALAILGTRGALVVHGDAGSDEITPAEMTTGYRVHADGKIERFRFTPDEAGLSPTELAPLAVADADESAAMVRAVLAGKAGTAADTVCLNVAAVLWLLGREPSMLRAFNHARELQSGGAGLTLLERVVAFA
jgi:anthranilate phosphoribosyltransferase